MNDLHHGLSCIAPLHGRPASPPPKPSVMGGVLRNFPIERSVRSFRPTAVIYQRAQKSQRKPKSLQSKPVTNSGDLLRWPLAGRMNQGQHPNRFAVDFVHQAITLMRYHLPGASDLSRLPKIGVIAQSCRRIAEQFVHSSGCMRIVGGNVVPHISTVLLCFRRPNNLHA